jgi:hypothetical protein
MKKLSRILMYCIVAAMIFTSCKKAPVRTIERGTWKITYYDDNGNDVSANFRSYNMEFLDDGTVQGGYDPHPDDKGVWSYNEDTKKYKFEFPACA